MLVKIVIIFLAAMAGLAMLGRYLFPRRKAPKRPAANNPFAGKQRKTARLTLCNACGRPIVDAEPCDCEARSGEGDVPRG
jgi:hypothetical protein